MAMNEDVARQFYLVRAVEREDAGHILLTREDREQADLAARAEVGEKSSRKAPEAYLAARARFAAARLSARNPAVARALKGMKWPDWLSVGLPLFGLFLGLLTNELGNGSRLNLLAFPLIGAIAWNLFVYIGILIAAVTRRRKAPGGMLSSLFRRIAGLGNISADQGGPLARGLARFAADWTDAAGHLTAHRSARTLHIAAAMFALGLIAGIFLRALAFEYRAGWESTFIGPDTVHLILSFILWPASLLTGVEIPDVGTIAELRWTGAPGEGANAGPWIILYTAIALIFIIVPRLLLAAFSAARTGVAARRIAIPGRDDFYVRKLMRAFGGAAGGVRVTAYAYHPAEDARQKLAAICTEALGDTVRLQFDPPVDYGAEESWLADAAAREQDDHHIILFTLSATPENENHGEFVKGIRQLAGSGQSVTAIVDESAFRAHFAGQTGLEDRIKSRTAAWQEVIRNAGAAPLLIDLATADPAAERERIEAAMVQNSSLAGQG
ncbi:DUF2868 domain-containing protein [Altererythrobacter aquiaggeris]|uniref:DUF2868 domain-containing protein n=1 Tax=Aestuarierythrobacter aquiaggeris TaxID=1898396 RepID=UPI00301A6DCC